MFFLDSWLLQAFILAATALICLYIYHLKVTAVFWTERRIPHLKPKFLIGNTLTLGTLQSLSDFFTEMYNNDKNKSVVGFWNFYKPALAIFDREIIKKVLSSDFSSFQTRVKFNVGDHDPLIKYNLFMINGPEWRNMRVKITPAFTTGKMKMMFPTMLQCGDELHQYLEATSGTGEPLECKDVLARFTINVIASCAFGLDTNALQNPDSEFRVYGKKVFEPTIPQILLNIVAVTFPFLGRLFKISQLPRGTTEFFVNAVKETMEFRELNKEKRNDFMQLLIQLKERGWIDDVDKADRENEDGAENKGTKFTLDEAAAQAFLFFAAGFETSSLTMTFVMYELAKNKNIQTKVKEEICEVMKRSDGNLTYDTINKLDYLDWVIQEAMRMYPANPVLLRETTKDYYLAEFDALIPKGTSIFIPSVCLVQDPELFLNPEVFDPTRFSPERRNEIPQYSHIPFGEGPRMCIGMRFAILQIKVGLISVLAHYSVDKCEKTPDKINLGVRGLTTTIVGGVHLKLVRD